MKFFVSPFRRFIQRASIVLSFFGIAEMGLGQYSGTYTFGSSGNVSSFNYNGSVISNLTVSAITKNGVTSSSSTGNFRASGWTTGSTNGDAAAGGNVDLTDYFEFTITADVGYTISNPTLNFGVGRSGTGPRRFQWRWSIDSYGSPLSVGTVNTSVTHSFGVLTTPDANAGYTGNAISATTSGQTTITFRFYAYGAEDLSGTGGLQGTLTFGGTLVAASTPTITSAATTYAFTTTYGTASEAQTFSISGNNLSADLVATAPTGFEVSSDGTTYGSTATFAQTSGSASGTLSIRLAATAAVGGSYNSQNIVLSSTGATSVNITTPASGNIVSAVAPSSPTITSITSGNEELSVAFTSPSSNGGTAITNYEYSVNGGVDFSALDPAQTTSPFVIASLSNGVSYDVQIRAVNDVGSGAASSTVQGTPTAAAVAPGAPTITSITTGNGQLSVAFSEGATGGSAIINYKYSTDGGTTFTAVSPASTASPIIITGLSNGTSYDVQIKAVNAVGDGAASTSVSGTPATTPSAPNITAINPGNGQLSVAFIGGATGGSTITNYKYSTDGGTTFTPVSPASTSSPIVITGLINGTSYDIQIKAVNAIGDGTVTSSVSATPYTTPGAPTIGTATAGNGQSTITFTAPVSNGGSPITSYTATSTPGGITGTISQAGSGTITVNGLTNGTTYTFTVVATNAAGSGQASAASNSVNVTLPAPTATSATSILNNGFTANWSAVGAASSGYLLDVSTSSTFENLALASDLFISEYVEGSGNNKYIEIYNGTGSNVDLSNYKLQLYINGGLTATNDVALSGNLANGNTVVYKNTSSTIYSGTTSSNAAVNFNGDDAVALYKISTSSYVDIFGVIGTDPGSEWTSALFSTLNKTLVRKSTIASGVTSNPSTFATLSTEWDQYSTDDVSHLGSHSFNSIAPSFVSGYNSKVISGQSSTTSGVTDLSEATTYYYRVRATDGSQSANSNVITVTTKKTPTVTPIIGTYTYTGSAQGPNSIVSQTPTPNSVTYSYTGTGATTYGPLATQPTNAGSYNVTATVQADDNYISGNATSEFTIVPAPLTITANNQSKCEGSVISFAGTEFIANGLVTPDEVNAITIESDGIASSATSGTYSIIPSSAIGTGLENYEISYLTNGVLTVNAPNAFRSYQSGNWSSTSTWEQGCGGSYYAAVSLPANTPVTIQNGHSVVANINVSVSNLAIESNSTLVVSNNRILSGGTITNSGTLDILSGGQLLQGSDTDISGGGQCIYRKSLPQVTNSALSGYNRSYYIGSPVVGASSTTPISIVSVLGSSTTGLNMYGYTETNNSWPLYYSGSLQSQGSTFDIGKGYFVNSSSGTFFSQANFTGNSFNNGDVTVTLTNTAGQGGGYNLISNPYPSGINWSNIYNDANNTSLVGSSYWLRTYQEGAGMTYKTCNASGVSTQGLNTIISPATGFWVKYTGTSPGTFTFKNAMRVGGAGTYYTMNANRIIRLDLGNGTYDDQAVVYMNEDAGLGIEAYDSDKRIPSTTVHQLYSLEGTTKLAINGFNNALAKDTVLLGLQIPTAGTYTINASQIDATIEEDVFLEDKITGAYQNLKTTPSYSFTSTQGTFNNRFVLHFAPYVPALPGQTAATAIAMPTSNWPQCNNVSTEDQWHAFTATSEGISIAVNTATTDIVIELQDGTGNVVAQENAVNGIGNETLNFFGLTAGQIYKVGVRNNISSQPTGTYGICVKSLKRGGCDYGAGPYSLCQYYKATWAGSTGVSYTFTFTGTSGPAAGQTFTRTQNSDICVLSTVTPLLPYGSTYDVVISNTYTLTDGAGNTEQITVPSINGCQVITIAEPQTTLSNSSSCNNGARFRGAVVSSMPWVCGSNNWRWRFTEVNPLTMQEVGLPIELNRGSASNYLSLGIVAQLQNGKTYAVQTAPMFSYTGTNYNWGPVQYMCIVGVAGMTLEGADAAQEAAQGSNKDALQDSSQENDVLVYATVGQQMKVWTNIENAELTNVTVRIYNSTGSLVYTQRMSSNEMIIDLDPAAGLYIVEVGGVKRKVVISPPAP